MRPRILIFILSLLSFHLSLLCSDALSWNELALEHFTVYYTPGDEKVAGEVGRAAEGSYKRLTVALGISDVDFHGRILLPDSE